MSIDVFLVGAGPMPGGVAPAVDLEEKSINDAAEQR